MHCDCRPADDLLDRTLLTQKPPIITTGGFAYECDDSTLPLVGLGGEVSRFGSRGESGSLRSGCVVQAGLRAGWPGSALSATRVVCRMRGQAGSVRGG